MKTVVLAEKPSVARDIARVLKCTKKGDGYLEGTNYIVTWALGHLVTLADPEFYDNKYKQWSMETLPILPAEMKTVVMPKTKKQYYAVVSQLKRKDVKDIVIATDAGREGELVARLILKQAKINKPLKRLWISSVTDKAIKDGFAHLQDGRKYENLYASAMARAKADWYVGINATRALTTKHNAQLSTGRVQTPTLAMIAMREQEIKEFKAQQYYGVQALAEHTIFTWQNNKTQQTRIFDESVTKDIVQKVQQHDLQITKVETKRKKQTAPLLYDLTELQRDANKRFGMSAKQTLQAMQGLYEQHKMLTYPRTDSRYISQDIVPTLMDRVKAIAVGEYVKPSTQIINKKATIARSVVNDAKVSDHHAIIPTEQRANISGLSDTERKIYDLVVRRFLSLFMPSFEYDETYVVGLMSGETFTAKGRVIIQQGWKDLYQKSEIDTDDVQKLPVFTEGQKVKVERISQTSGMTTPPARLTEATLLSAMEKPAKYVKGLSKDVIAQLDAAGGLGTVATRADIIDKLFNSFVIEKKDQAIYVTPKGMQLLQLAPEKLCSPVLTAQWEQQLTNIALGKQKEQTFIAEIKAYTKEAIREIDNSKAVFKHQNISTKVCSECGKPMLEVNGKKGKMLVCSDRNCGKRKYLSQVTNARCPECKKKLELFGEGDGRIFVCRCGYREKLSAFEKRRANSSQSSASKSEVANFLRKQKSQEEQPATNAFAKAFSNLKK